MASNGGYDSSNSTFSSSGLSKNSMFSSPMTSIDRQSSNSSSTMTGCPSPKGSVFASSMRNERDKYSGACGDMTWVKGRGNDSRVDDCRVSSWAQLLDFPGGQQEVAAVTKHSVDMSKLFLGQKFACGTYSRLYRGQYKDEEVAVKLVRQPEDDAAISNRLDRQFVQEVSLLSGLHHENIVHFVGAVKKPPVFCVITEYLEGGSLKSFLQKEESPSLSIDMVLDLALDIARGMDYLHSQGVLHLDLKSPNLVLSHDWRVKITDFGVARTQAECMSMTPDSGTYRWMAPEMISDKIFSTKSDVYSFGIILWEIITGQTPYQEMSTIQAAFAVVDKNVRPIIPKDCLPPLKQLMEECWSANPDKRPHFWQIVERLEKCKACVRQHLSFGLPVDCKKKTWLALMLRKFSPGCAKFANPEIEDTSS